MKIIFSVPPVNTSKGQAQATQNRQYQFFKDATYIFPVIPSLFLTMLASCGQDVFLGDCIAENVNQDEFYKFISEMNPDFMVFEANTMVCKSYWKAINDVKKNFPKIKIILTGEHLTACPEESKSNCNADYFVEGGKWYYECFKIITGKDWDGNLPRIDREIARWYNYAYSNGNYKYLPATYTMAAQDCWYRPKHADGSTKACTFCTWVNYHPENSVRSVDDFIFEVEHLVNFGFREFFDDSGTFPVGKWLHEFCNRMINDQYKLPNGQLTTLNKWIHWGCNMRFKALKPEEFALMAKAGCRFILWGFESANQKTLDILSKGYDIKNVSPNLIASKTAGIWNHLTVMNGYPWETLEEEYNTYKMVKWLLLNGWASSMQSTIFMPYPGTVAFKELKDQGLILTEDWDKWDMTNEVVKLKYPFEEALKLQRKYYNISYHPKFLLNKIKNIKSKDDLIQYWMIMKKVINRFAGVHYG